MTACIVVPAAPARAVSWTVTDYSGRILGAALPGANIEIINGLGRRIPLTLWHLTTPRGAYVARVRPGAVSAVFRPV